MTTPGAATGGDVEHRALKARLLGIADYGGSEENVRNLCRQAAEALSPSDRDMREISTCDTWRYHHMNTMLAYWSSRGWCETYWDEDDDFDDRPKGWVSPESGWRGVGDMCIPVNQNDVTHWMPMPAPPSQTGKEG